MWPFKFEKRASTSYTDAVTTALVNAASGGGKTTAMASGVLEAASGMISRCFLIANIQGGRGIVTPTMLADTARALIRRGEIVYVLRNRSDSMYMASASSWDISGDVDPETWMYNCELAGPTGTISAKTPAQGVCHFKYASDPGRPWAGLGPIQLGSSTSVLLGNLEKSMSEEATGTVGRIMPIPADGDDATIKLLKDDLKNLSGRTSMVEGGDWGMSHGNNAPRFNWSSHRVGPEYTDAEAAAMEQASKSVASACGVPVELILPGYSASAGREAWRRMLHGTVQPLSELIAMELSLKLEDRVRLSFDRLFASDLQGRSRSFQSLVKGGLDIPTSQRLSGLSEE